MVDIGQYVRFASPCKIVERSGRRINTVENIEYGEPMGCIPRDNADGNTRRYRPRVFRGLASRIRQKGNGKLDTKMAEL